MTEVLLFVCGTVVCVVHGYHRRGSFAAWLTDQCCPWCATRYGDRPARKAMKGQCTTAKAFAVAWGRCQRAQLLVPGPSVEEFRQRANLLVMEQHEKKE